MMRHSLAKMLVTALAAQLIPAFAETLSLACSIPVNEHDEQKRIRQFAKGVVERKSERELQVTINGNMMRFVDKPPYDEPGGTRYHFCDRKDGFILLMVDDDYIFTGKLINEANGHMTSGGQEVVFSPDKRAYFATEQPDGLDGSVWNIYAVDGRRSWTGFSYIPRNGNRDYIAAGLTNPKWESNGEFSAEASCILQLDTKWKVKLVKIAGKWDWLPKRKCPEQ